MSDTDLHEPMLLGEARHIRFQTEEKGYLLPYIQMDLGEIIELDDKEKRSLVVISFHRAIVRIRGKNLETLVKNLQREEIFLIRKGISKEEGSPEIDLLEVVKHDGNGQLAL